MVTKADFIGFEFAGKHSSELGIIRTSDGDRFSEQLVPEIKDITVEVPGMHGEYFFGSTYGNRTFEVQIAYDHLTEEQFREMRKLYGRRNVGELIFDERPYKKYLAKIESPIELSFVCFDEPKRIIGVERDGVRVANRTPISTTTSMVTTVSEGLEVSLDETIFQSIFSNDGDYQFIYHSPIWYYIEDEEEAEVDLTLYGISVVLPENSEEEFSFTITTTTVINTEIQREQITPYEYDYEQMERIYKGDGSISFICYFPFAKSVYKQLPFEYVLTSDVELQQNKKYYTFNEETLLYELVESPTIENIQTYYERVNRKEVADWAVSSGLLSVNEYELIDKYDNETGVINVYNAGDVPTGFRLYIPFGAGAESTLEPITLTYKNILNAEMADILSIEAITKKDNDVGILIDTNNGLIVGVKPQLTTETSIVYDSQTGALVNAEAQNVEVGIIYDINGNAQYSTSGNIYNEYVEAGDFFKLQPNLKNDGATIEITGGKEGIEIFYDYLYF